MCQGSGRASLASKGAWQIVAAAWQCCPANSSKKTTVTCECRYQYTVFKEASSDPSDILPGHENIDVDASTSSINWVGGLRARFDIVARDGAPLPPGRYTVSASHSRGAASLHSCWRLVADACERNPEPVCLLMAHIDGTCPASALVVALACVLPFHSCRCTCGR